MSVEPFQGHLGLAPVYHAGVHRPGAHSFHVPQPKRLQARVRPLRSAHCSREGHAPRTVPRALRPAPR